MRLGGRSVAKVPEISGKWWLNFVRVVMVQLLLQLKSYKVRPYLFCWLLTGLAIMRAERERERETTKISVFCVVSELADCITRRAAASFLKHYSRSSCWQL
jgi:hypothetical protein